jgi:hypothetical protein
MDESPLSRFSHEDLVAEFRRRYIAFVISIVFVPEGKFVGEPRIDYGCKSRAVHEILGLAKLTVDNISSTVQLGLSPLLHASLDPPNPPKPTEPPKPPLFT